MSYLIRVLLPDAPGSLGRLAEAIGTVGGNIKSVDVVESLPDGTVMDDMVISLPTNTITDVLIRAGTQLPRRQGLQAGRDRPRTGARAAG